MSPTFPGRGWAEIELGTTWEVWIAPSASGPNIELADGRQPGEPKPARASEFISMSCEDWGRTGGRGVDDISPHVR